MKDVKVEQGRKWYYGVIEKETNGVFYIRYDFDGMYYTGWFNRHRIEFLYEKPVFKTHEYKKNDNIKIRCKCGYWTIVWNRNPIGKCPECMAENWDILEDMGRW